MADLEHVIRLATTGFVAASATAPIPLRRRAELPEARRAQGESAAGTAQLGGQVGAALRHHHPEIAQPPTRIIAVPAGQGFDWADAGIGAAATLGALPLATGSMLALKRGRRREMSGIGLGRRSDTA